MRPLTFSLIVKSRNAAWLGLGSLVLVLSVSVWQIHASADRVIEAFQSSGEREMPSITTPTSHGSIVETPGFPGEAWSDTLERHYQQWRAAEEKMRDV